MGRAKADKWIREFASISSTLLLAAAVQKTVYARTDSVKVKTIGICYSTDVTPEEGWKRALQDAEANAIRIGLGIKVSGQTIQITSESMSGNKPSDYLSVFSELNTTTTSGRIIAEHAYDSTLTTESDVSLYSIKLRALVAKDRSEPDPNFRADTHIDRDTYCDRGAIDRNDALMFPITATHDCYVYLFDIMANDFVMLFLPDSYFSDNFYSAAEGQNVLDKKNAKLPIKLRASLPPGKETTTEMLYLVALKKKVNFYSLIMTRESLGIIPTYQSALLDLQEWLVSIPQEMSTTASATFLIKRLK